jgi:hypothetical protein
VNGAQSSTEGAGGRGAKRAKKSAKVSWNKNTLLFASGLLKNILVVTICAILAGSNTYTSDIVELGATYSVADFSSRPVIGSEVGRAYRRVFSTTQDITNPSVPDNLRDESGSAEDFHSDIDSFWASINAARLEFDCDAVWLVGHNVHTHEAVALNACHERAGMSFGDRLRAATCAAQLCTLQLCRASSTLTTLARKGLTEVYAHLLGGPFLMPRSALGRARATAMVMGKLWATPPADGAKLGRLMEPSVRHLQFMYEKQQQKRRSVGPVADSGSDSPDPNRRGIVELDDGGSDSDDGGPVPEWTDVTDQAGVFDGPAKRWEPNIQFTPKRGRVEGPVRATKDWSLMDIFLSFFTPKMIGIAVSMTNTYAAQTARTAWYDLDRVEFIGFLGAVVYMCVKGLTRIRVWKPAPFGDEFLSSLFLVRRFQDIFACLHFCDNELVDDEARRGDAFWKITPLIVSLRQQFLEGWNPPQTLSVDERTVGYKGRHRAKQYNKDKPQKWGFKFFACCCANTGYLLWLHPYQGKDQQRPEGQALGHFAVMSVVPPRLDNCGHIIVADNWFTSVALIVALTARGFDYLGTARNGRRGQPAKKDFSLAPKAPRGTLKVLQLVTTNGDRIYATVWKDKKDVRLLSTFTGPVGTCQRKIKATASSPFESKSVAQPVVIGKYNSGMGGVDLLDMTTASVKAKIRSVRPTRVMFIDLVQVTAANTKIVWAFFNGPTAIIDSMEILSEQLMEPLKKRCPPLIQSRTSYMSATVLMRTFIAGSWLPRPRKRNKAQPQAPARFPTLSHPPPPPSILSVQHILRVHATKKSPRIQTCDRPAHTFQY